MGERDLPPSKFGKILRLPESQSIQILENYLDLGGLSWPFR